ALLGQAETRLEQDRIAEQPAYAPEVARRVEEVGVARRGVARAREPALAKRARRRDREEGESDGGREQREQPRDRVRRRGRRPARRDADRQDEERKEDEAHVERGLAACAEPGRGRVRVEISREERGLVEDEARVPHRGRAAEERQDHPGEHRLDQEEERGGQKDGGGVDDQEHARGAALATLINCDKGLPNLAFFPLSAYVRTRDLPKVVRDWPRLAAFFIGQLLETL